MTWLDAQEAFRLDVRALDEDELARRARIYNGRGIPDSEPLEAHAPNPMGRPLTDPTVPCPAGHPMVGPDAEVYDRPGRHRPECAKCHRARQVRRRRQRAQERARQRQERIAS